jgi:CHAD domain-containing protein
MEELIKKYLKKDDPDVLHDLRVEARKRLANLEKENKTDLGLKRLLKLSSKLRDTDVLYEICKSKKVKKYLKKRHEKLRKKFIEFLKNFKNEIVNYNAEIKEEECFRVLNTSFLNKTDKELHNIRIIIKKCRYAYNMPLKRIQDYLGKAHDYYNCEKLLLKFGKNPKKAVKKKKKFIKKAEKERIYLSCLHSLINS